jgi:hypothetical protein
MLCSIKVVGRHRDQSSEQRHQAPRLSLGHPGRRLVEEKEGGRRGQRAREFQSTLLAIGQVLGDLVRLGAEADHLEER